MHGRADQHRIGVHQRLVIGVTLHRHDPEDLLPPLGVGLHRVNLHDLRAQRAQDPEGVMEVRLHAGGEVGQHRGHHTETEPLHAALDALHEVHRRTLDAVEVIRVVALEDVQHQRAVHRAPRHRAGVVEGVRERNDA